MWSQESPASACAARASWCATTPPPTLAWIVKPAFTWECARSWLCRLRGAMGIAGVMEAFSTRGYAFGSEQIDTLRALAEIAEIAYDREGRVPKPAATSVNTAGRLSALFAAPSVATQPSHFSGCRGADSCRQVLRRVFPETELLDSGGCSRRVAPRRDSGVVELARTPRAKSQPVKLRYRPSNPPEETSGNAAPRVVPLKPDAAIVSQPLDSMRTKDVLQNAAAIDPEMTASRSCKLRSQVPP